MSDLKEIISQCLEKNKLDEIYCLEYSEYSSNKHMFPFHITTLKDAIQSNIQDMFYNHRRNNKWQIVFVGAMDECYEALEVYSKNQEHNAKHYCSKAVPAN